MIMLMLIINFFVNRLINFLQIDQLFFVNRLINKYIHPQQKVSKPPCQCQLSDIYLNSNCILYTQNTPLPFYYLLSISHKSKNNKTKLNPMNHPPTHHQHSLTLHYIITQAHKKYLQQYKYNKSTPFNIIRVLSTFNQLFPTSPSQIYQLILLITKYHNPQTLQQWIYAIQKIHTQPQPIYNANNSRSQLHLNQSSIKQSEQSRILKHKLHENSVKTYKQQLDHQIDYIQSKRSRINLIGDFRITQPSWMTEHLNQDNKQNNMAQSNKNSLRNSQHAHLISFQPTHKESIKQNAQKLRSMIKQPHNFSQTQKCQLSKKLQLPRKINPYHEITRIDNLSLIQDRQPTSKDESKTMYSHNTRTQSNSRMYFHSKTPRDNSFVRVMALDSKDSDVSMRKSQLIAGKSGEILQFQDYNMSLQEWQEINDRALIFSEFNTKLKAFSALLANYQAFESDRYLKNKADIFHSCYLETKAFIGLRSNVHHEQTLKIKINKAEDFHNKNLSKKIWKVLQVLRDLRIQGPKKSFQVQNLNRINYQFMLSFMFQQKVLWQNSPQKMSSDKNDQSLDFDRKVQYFSQTQNFENVWNIYKYFGLNITLSKDQLAQFFKNYHQCLQKTIFSLLKQNVDKRKHKYLELHNKRLIQKTFSILLGRKDITKEYKLNENRAERYANKRLKQKAYKILLSIVYSTKIFSKRQEFIETQREQKTKMKILRKWVSQYKAGQLRKKALSQKLDMFIRSLAKFIQKIAFKSIKRDSIETEQRAAFMENYWLQKTQKKVMKHLLNLVQNKKKYISLCQTNQIEFQKKILSKWLNASKISYGLRNIQICFNKIIFRKIFVPLAKSVVKQYLMNQEDEKNLVKECFDVLRANFQSNQNQRNQCIISTEKNLKMNLLSQFLKSLQLNRMQQIKGRKKQELKAKSLSLIKNLEQSSRQKLYIRLKESYFSNTINHQRKMKLKKYIINQSLELFMKKTTQYMNLKENSQRLAQYLKFTCFQSLRSELSKNITEKRTIELKLRTQKRVCSKFTEIISKNYSIMMLKKGKAQDHYKKNTQRKGLYGLAKNFIQITEKSHTLQKMLLKSRSNDYLGQFFRKTKKQMKMRQNQQQLMKMQPFSSLKGNLRLKRREKDLKQSLRQTKIQQALNTLDINKQIKQQHNKLTQKQITLQESIFWRRFNRYFIDNLMEKKHTFMAYKFRALKLYAVTFDSWRQLILINKKRNGHNNHRNQHQLYEFMDNNNSNQNQHRRDKSLNLRTKDLTHMYKPTDCEE